MEPNGKVGEWLNSNGLNRYQSVYKTHLQHFAGRRDSIPPTGEEPEGTSNSLVSLEVSPERGQAADSSDRDSHAVPG